MWINLIFLFHLCTLLIYGLVTNKPQDKPGYVRVDFEMKNITKYKHDQVRIRCEITGDPIPRYTWYLNDTPIVEDRKFKITPTNWGSKLRISRIETTDAGFYMCEGTNKFEKANTSGFIFVINELNPNPDIIRDRENEDDDATGSFDYNEDYYDNLMPVNNPDMNDKMYGDAVKNKKGFCQPYRGAACSKFIGDKSIFVTSKTQQGMVENNLTAALTVIATSHDLSQRCGDYAIPALCLYAFPFCSTETSDPEPKFMCREECLRLKNEYCANEYAKAKLGPEGISLFVGPRFVLPDCEKLPVESDPVVGDCLKIGMPVKDFYSEAPHSNRDMKEVMMILIPSIAVPISLALLLALICICRKNKQYKNKQLPNTRRTQQSDMSTVPLKKPAYQNHISTNNGTNGHHPTNLDYHTQTTLPTFYGPINPSVRGYGGYMPAPTRAPPMTAVQCHHPSQDPHLLHNAQGNPYIQQKPTGIPNNVLYKKTTPPGSQTSGKSSPLHSSNSSGNNKQNPYYHLHDIENSADDNYMEQLPHNFDYERGPHIYQNLNNSRQNTTQNHDAFNPYNKVLNGFNSSQIPVGITDNNSYNT